MWLVRKRPESDTRWLVKFSWENFTWSKFKKRAILPVHMKFSPSQIDNSVVGLSRTKNLWFAASSPVDVCFFQISTRLIYFGRFFTGSRMFGAFFTKGFTGSSLTHGVRKLKDKSVRMAYPNVRGFSKHTPPFKKSRAQKFESKKVASTTLIEYGFDFLYTKVF